MNGDGSQVPVKAGDGSLTIKEMPGDLNGDGSVDSDDSLLLRKLIVGWDVTVEGEPDVNGDGKVTLADSLLLRQHLLDSSIVLN